MSLSNQEIESLKERSRILRLEIFDGARKYGGYHFGGSLSAVEILVSLYKKILTPIDRFILSKGHAAIALYPLLVEQGYSPNRTILHPDLDLENGINCTSGSLGTGFPVGLGMAFARKIQGKPGRIFVLMGEAECQEGTTWESLLLAKHHKLDNLMGIIDRNNFQGSDSVESILSLGDLSEKFKAFGAKVIVVDGHSHQDLINALTENSDGRCTIIIANTIKGKGAKIMEQDPASWHGNFPPQEQLEQIYKDLGGEMK